MYIIMSLYPNEVCFSTGAHQLVHKIMCVSVFKFKAAFLSNIGAKNCTLIKLMEMLHINENFKIEVRGKKKKSFVHFYHQAGMNFKWRWCFPYECKERSEVVSAPPSLFLCLKTQ